MRGDALEAKFTRASFPIRLKVPFLSGSLRFNLRFYRLQLNRRSH